MASSFAYQVPCGEGAALLLRCWQRLTLRGAMQGALRSAALFELPGTKLPGPRAGMGRQVLVEIEENPCLLVPLAASSTVMKRSFAPVAKRSS